MECDTSLHAKKSEEEETRGSVPTEALDRQGTSNAVGQVAITFPSP